MDIAAYLHRLNYSGPQAPTFETLCALHRAHLLSVPFENLSIGWGEPIVLTDEALFGKIVRRRRGGFCYELNGLFAGLLKALGFTVTMLEAGVASPSGGFGPPFDHMTLMVELRERWLADVGFGDGFMEPLRLNDRREQLHGTRGHLFRESADGLLLLQRDHASDAWNAQYRFRLVPSQLADYVPMCRYHQTSPESIFTQRRICSLATTDGRVTLSDTRLLVTKGDTRVEREVATPEDYAKVLRECFGIEAPAVGSLPVSHGDFGR